MNWIKSRDAHFLGLQTAVICVACELISENNTPYCLACGSSALIGLSRVLGGSLRGQQTAHLIADAELDRLVRELLRTVPVSSTADIENHLPVSFASLAPGRSHVRCASSSTGAASAGYVAAVGTEIDLEPAISVIAERAQTLTGASGAAIALRKGDEMVCRARPAALRPTSEFVCSPIPVFQPTVFAPVRLCSAMTRKRILRSIWPPVSGWECDPFWLLRCVIFAGHSACSKFSPPLLMPSLPAMSPPCNFFPA